MIDTSSFYFGWAAGWIVLLLFAFLGWAVLQTEGVKLADMWGPLRRLRRGSHTHYVAIWGGTESEAANCLHEFCGEAVMIVHDTVYVQSVEEDTDADASRSVAELAELLDPRGTRQRD